MHLWKSWRDHQRLQLKLFIFPLPEKLYIVMYGLLYDYVKPKLKAKLCYTDTGSFIVCMKTEDIYAVIAKYVKTRFILQIMN